MVRMPPSTRMVAPYCVCLCVCVFGVCYQRGNEESTGVVHSFAGRGGTPLSSYRILFHPRTYLGVEGIVNKCAVDDSELGPLVAVEGAAGVVLKSHGVQGQSGVLGHLLMGERRGDEGGGGLCLMGGRRSEWGVCVHRAWEGMTPKKKRM